MSFRIQSIQTRLTALIMAAAVLPPLLLFVAITLQQGKLQARVGAEIDQLTHDHLGVVSADIHSLCETQHQSILQSLAANMRVAQREIARRGGIHVGREEVSWEAVNQVSKATERAELPRLLLGSDWLGQCRDARTPVLGIDEIVRQVGGTCTIFQRMNERGDMLRVATNVIGADGSRAIGTYVPATGSDGSPNPVVASVLRGEPFTGRALVVDTWNITRYEPIRDDVGAVIGMLYVGLAQESVPHLRQAIMERKLGQTGYVFVLGGKDSQRGRYIISKDGKRDGEEIWGAKDSDGNLFIQGMVQAGLANPDGKITFHRYPWKNQGETQARYKLAAVTYFEPWDWVIGASAYEDEFMAANRKIDGAIRQLYGAFFVTGLIGMTVVVLVSLRLIRKLVVRPIRGLAAAADRLAQGNTEVELGASTQDEIGDLNRAMTGMAENTRRQAEVAERISRGDLSVEVPVRGERDLLGKSMLAVVTTQQALLAELRELTAAAVAGRLSARGDGARFQGGYREIVHGVNETLDAVVTPIQEAAEVLQRVADCDLSSRVQGDYAGDHARIKDALNRAVSTLDESLSRVSMAADQVAAAAGQIGKGSQSLAEGASEQASSLEEVSASLHEMSSVTRQNAGSAHEARTLADNTRGRAKDGLESMGRLSEAVTQIKTSSDSTAKIVKTIDEIAFQTNLLALNAAVEAARAGEAGRGFAVVADEVRNLATRSAEAARNSADMIEQSVRHAESGVMLNDEVLSRLREIAQHADRVGEVMAEIAQASAQQDQGLGQVTLAMEQMNQLTQANAAGSQESAAAAEELSAQAAELRTLVARFRLSARDAAWAGMDEEEAQAA